MSLTHVLVTGGAGFIGSHTCKALAQQGFTPVVIDNLSKGYKEFVKWGPFIQASIQDAAIIKQVIDEYKPVACLHFAAFSEVGEASREPLTYFNNNVANSIIFFDTLVKQGVKHIVFSSTAATYGNPQTDIINEDHPQNPLNAYGKGKLMIETVLNDIESAYGVSHVSLRYFNAAGADPDGEVGESHNPETHLIPLICDAALGKRDAITIFGSDYPTPDNTCIRDYIHVTDLAQAHVLALNYLLDEGKSHVFNLGNGQGFSVKEVIHTAEKVTGLTVPVIQGERREGDPPILVADAKLIKKTLCWEPQFSDLDTIISHAWTWRKR